MNFYPLIRPFLFTFPAEAAHILALKGVKLYPSSEYKHELLEQNLFGMTFLNPVGLSAGFDKNAESLRALSKLGFGFVEAGTVTPLPQDGNPKPRMFRLVKDEAVINRLGFNNKGLDVFCDNLGKTTLSIPVGANIGKNKDQTDAIADYIRGLKAVSPLADYVTVNVSSPNTKNLRALQEKDALADLLAALMEHRSKPILLKVAPDLDSTQIKQIARTVLDYKIDGLIVSNTTITRPASLNDEQSSEAGGLSGQPLFELSTQTLKAFAQEINREIPIIGVGGIGSAEQAYAKIRVGASLVQLYSALVYGGPVLVNQINRGLVKLLKADGFSHISEAIGVDI